MHQKFIRTSLSNSFYFSIVSFIIIWLASFLYDTLEKTVGSLDIGIVIIIALGLILLVFLLAITNIILFEPEKGKILLGDKIIGVLIFIIVSAVILAVLGVLFWLQI
ncbi:MAG: hypothetical protein KKF46_00935 [Nanoarchaeota archaeon]|nr:hypothetical protein [Nanoarchaeota archaeon]MBU1320899.1 hypothetical protein [Nanoarchaeota archaeon]MBU1597577.1 hypothetical protein [Nanoarchaeota archaeon]MBU2441508.1 hypothetical protein [Nanoarchaeota archaeon]